MLETVLQLQNPHWEGKVYSGLFSRHQQAKLLKKLPLKEIQVLLGVRRSGKSTLFKLIINQLLLKADPRSILYLNLDDPFFAEVWESPKHLYKVIETAEMLTNTKTIYLFLDEVQNINAWERFVKSTYDSEIFKKIFITGSNSSLLKSHYASLLSGRYIVDYVMPLSFKEILECESINTHLTLVKKKIKVLKILEKMLFYGSFPQIWKTSDTQLRREQLLNYYETIVLKDCIANHNIRETKKLQELSLYLLTNNASIYSYNNLAKKIDSNENTVKQFIQILENSFLIQEFRQFSYSYKQQIRAPKKSYCIDNGLMHAISIRFSDNCGKLFENLVYSELCKMGYKEIYFLNNKKECDFIIKVNDQLIAIQATFELNKNNYDREVDGLIHAMDELPIVRGYIVTFNSEEKKIDKNKHIIPFWKLFFNHSI